MFQRWGILAPSPMPLSASQPTGGVKVGFQECEKEGDEGIPDTGLKPGSKEMPGRGKLRDPEAPYSGELVG